MTESYHTRQVFAGAIGLPAVQPKDFVEGVQRTGAGSEWGDRGQPSPSPEARERIQERTRPALRPSGLMRDTSQ